jgi:hypothetical protein
LSEIRYFVLVGVGTGRATPFSAKTLSAGFVVFGRNQFMRNKTFMFIVLAIFAAGNGLAQQPEPVGTECGFVQGTSDDGLTVYRGIPVGELLCPPRNGKTCGKPPS